QPVRAGRGDPPGRPVSAAPAPPPPGDRDPRAGVVAPAHTPRFHPNILFSATKSRKRDRWHEFCVSVAGQARRAVAEKRLCSRKGPPIAAKSNLVHADCWNGRKSHDAPSLDRAADAAPRLAA